MKVLVTGGNGFLGRAIVRQLLDRGHTARSFSREPSAALDLWEVEQIQGDMRDRSAVKQAVEGCEAVIHTAAKAGVWGTASQYEPTNVQGTRNLLEAAKSAGIDRFVHTSSPSVVFDGKDEINLSEDKAVYPKSFLTQYARTKALAEQEVLAANGPEFATVALRPHLIWGPGDPHLLPRLWARALSGRLRVVGSGTNRIDTTYIDNAALAHLLALEKLSSGAKCAGQAYFISNGEPLPIAELFGRFLEVAGLPTVIPVLPEWMAKVLAWWLELRAAKGSESEPLLTRFVVLQLAREHWFDLSKAKKDLGYEPKVSLSAGLDLLKKSLATVKMPDTSFTLCVGH